MQRGMRTCTRRVSAQRDDQVRTRQGEVSHLQAKQKDLGEISPAGLLILDSQPPKL